MSTKIEFQKRRREMERRRRYKNYMYSGIGIIILCILIFLIIKGVSSNVSKNKNEDIEFVFNGYVYPKPPDKDSNILVDAKKADGVKKAYLTFDDGPNNSVTLSVLDVLRKYNIKATFFLVGTLIEENQDSARRLYDEGHLIANHSYSHNYSELYSDLQTFMNQVNYTHELICKITDDINYPKVFRFPGGGYNAGSYGQIKQEAKKELEKNGYKYCDWNALTGDAETITPTREYVVKRLKDTVGEQEDVVILLHDALSKKVTASSLSEMIEYLIDKGYEFDTLDNV